MRGRRRGGLVALLILTGVIVWPAQTLEAQQKLGLTADTTRPDRCRRQIATSNAGGTISGNCYGRKAGTRTSLQSRRVSAPTLRWTNARLALAAEQRLTDMLTYTVGNDRCVFPYIPGFGNRGESCTPIPPQTEAAPTPDIDGIVYDAAVELIAEKGTVGVLPGRALTGLPTYFSLDIDDTRERDVSEEGIDLHLEASVVSYRWDFGDGTTMRGGKGTADSQDSEIAHTYTRTGDYTPSVTATWEVTFTANGETAVAPGEFTTTSTGDVEVTQIRTRLTR
jgi:hypothetical protein